MQCYEYTFFGRVQGVGFRWSTKNKCNELKIIGNVKNMPDGSVMALICGDSWQIQQFDTWLSQGGPKFSKISNFEKNEVNISDLPIGFLII